MAFPDIPNLKRYYAGQAGKLVNEFYTPVLSHAVHYDRQAGYFNTATLVQLASGMASFIRRIKNMPPEEFPAMRLVTGATWTQNDIYAFQRGRDALTKSLGQSLIRRFEPSDDECFQLGLPAGWRPEEDPIAQNRLGAFAWMVSAGILDVRVALPLDHNGRPWTPGRQGALYHPKSGVLRDAAGNFIYFQGSVNETGAAWTRNREKFDIRRSWVSDQDLDDIRHEIGEFETIWRGGDSGLLVLTLPKAVREYMTHFIPPDGPPERDPMEPSFSETLITREDRLEARRLLEAPRNPGGEALVLEPLWADGRRLRPYPHQKQVIQRIMKAFPRSFLFCDEVGLGKTIEAGISLRGLILRGDVSRALIIAPKNLIRQWMEELREKLALTVWWCDGSRLIDVGGRVRQPDHPFEEDGIIIASRHLLARSDRLEEILGVQRPWDLVIVDEAHAARQAVFGDRGPNRFLHLLQQMKSMALCRSLWLLTATPMQLDPAEVHDLLLLCGLSDPTWREWSTLLNFNRYFDDLREFHLNTDARDWVIDMSRIAVAHGAPDLQPNNPPRTWTTFHWGRLIKKLQSGVGLKLALKKMPADRAEAMTPFLSRQTPLSVHMFRYTRATLRAYQERGLLRALANRTPEDVGVSFETTEERDLYVRIDELCAKFYRLSELPDAERKGVGFLMAVFRKRLSSSFAAFRKSLVRRHDMIEALQMDLDDFEREMRRQRMFYEEDDDYEEETHVAQALRGESRRLRNLYQNPERRDALDQERRYLKDYILALDQITSDSKFDAFYQRLTEVVREGRRVIVFTQYLDTLDFIRERLAPRFGDRIACYSGRGGELWDPALNQWRLVEKAEVKARAGAEHSGAIRVLLGTEAASEGLNLQQFSALFNYDIPWNPMRVEQRIGRIDRIGQEAPEVRVLNLYMKDTIEEDAYHTLMHRIRLFEDVVGPLQPILADMPKIFLKIARGELEMAEARALLDEAMRREADAPLSTLENYALQNIDDQRLDGDVADAPFTQRQLATWCLAHHAPGMRVTAVPEPGASETPGDGTTACLAIVWPDAPAHLGVDSTEEMMATFNGELADRHPPSGPSRNFEAGEIRNTDGVRLLTWGDPYLEAWLTAIGGEAKLEEGDGNNN